MKKLKGSLTIFLSLILVFTSGLFFTLSEVTRFMSLKSQSARASELSFESIFAEYNIPLWENYGILGVDGAYGKDAFDIKKVGSRLSANMELNGTADGVSFLQEAPSRSEISEYTLLTDNSNAAFIKEAAIFMGTHVAESAIEEIQDLTSQYQNASKGITDEDIENAPTNELSAEELSKLSTAEDPRESESEFKKKDLLDSFIPEGKEVSDKKISHSNLPSKRSFRTGTGQIESPSTMEGILFKFYLFENFSSYEKHLNHPGIKYEQEYLIFGKDNDRENLKTMVAAILAFRVAANNISLLTDSNKKSQAKGLATLLGFWTFNDAVIKGIEAAIIESWAFAESVRDVRSIMDGEKVPLMKRNDDWTTTIFTIASSFVKGAKAKKSDTGIDYDDYLKIMIFLKPEGTLSDMALDVIEDSIRSVEHYENFRVDNMLISMKADVNYQAKPLFLSYVLFLNGDVSIYDFPKEMEKSYLTYKLEPE